MNEKRHPLIAKDSPWLAPLAGFSDLPFRLLCREHGCSVACTEMVSAKGLVYGGPGTGNLLDTSPQDTPLVVQLFGAEPEFIEKAMGILLERGYEYFDLNSGCPVKKVTKTGAGAALHNDVDRLEAIVAVMAKLAPGRTGVKFRLGWAAGEENYLEIGKRMEQAGASWLSLHPRHAKQGYSGTANWDALAELVGAVETPVIASGDLFTAEDGVRCIEETGVSGVMFARGALYGPHIFERFRALMHGETPITPDGPAIADMIRRHAELAREYFQGRKALVKMRTIVPRYVRDTPGSRILRSRVVACTSWEELDEIVTDFLCRQPEDTDGAL
ncbi:tRNA-dihydrouridine synthase B [Desulfobaculum xiamenense]|uniref:tRNA-dihydrouridine synthase n=1 Tax=Desulfobaculum xiamenense TaxID=995050 RepID=A0A846QE93_9BACT|nr:tRNA-dihydrouridine synthase family protein [Desulfobaculum xiamenense]NJB67056.1 tRNA-dihydrouridine synthase B [Desulfobaculum xiamenense]